jgi:hypothetical protein
MSLAIPMEISTLESAIESTAVLTAAVQRVLLDAQENFQSCISNQQKLFEIKKQLNDFLRKQYYKLHAIEYKSRDIHSQLQKMDILKANSIAHELKTKLLIDSLIPDINGIKNSYLLQEKFLKEYKIISFTSFSTKRILTKIYNSLEKTIFHIKSIQNSFNKIRQYSNTEYENYQKNYLLSIAPITNEPLYLESEDLEFILDSLNVPVSPPTPAMQRALERYAKCS